MCVIQGPDLMFLGMRWFVVISYVFCFSNVQEVPCIPSVVKYSTAFGVVDPAKVRT